MSQREGVVNMREVPEQRWERGRFGRREQDLGRAAGSATLGLRREVIPPGKQSSPRHAHMADEEIFVVLRGRGTLRGEGSAWRWRPGTWPPSPPAPAWPARIASKRSSPCQRRESPAWIIASTAR